MSRMSQVYEMGASIIHSRNRYMATLTKAMNLTASQPAGTQATFAIYDGHSFVHNQAGAITVLEVACVIPHTEQVPLFWLCRSQVRALYYSDCVCCIKG